MECTTSIIRRSVDTILALAYVMLIWRSDSDIRVRRKIAFLLNSLLMPTSDERVVLQSNMNAPSSANSPVHPNSHASMVSNPSSISTWNVTLAALQSESAPEGSSLLDALVSALTEPVPFGPDGENDKDREFEETIVRQVHLYIATVFGTLTPLKGFIHICLTLQRQFFCRTETQSSWIPRRIR